MTLFTVGSMVFALLTLGLLAAFYITGAKNHTLRRYAGVFGILSALLWLLKTFMR